MDIPMKSLTLQIIRNPEYIINEDGALVVIIRNWLTNGEILHNNLVKEIPWILGQVNFF